MRTFCVNSIWVQTYNIVSVWYFPPKKKYQHVPLDCSLSTETCLNVMNLPRGNANMCVKWVALFVHLDLFYFRWNLNNISTQQTTISTFHLEPEQQVSLKLSFLYTISRCTWLLYWSHVFQKGFNKVLVF